MEAKLFEPMVTGWSAEIKWPAVKLKKASSLLLAISKANGGESIANHAAGAETIRQHAWQCASDALGRRTSLYAKTIRSKFTAPFYSAPTKKQISDMLPELVSHEWNEQININTDDPVLLALLPGIGSATALEIIRFCRKNGPFSSLEELEQIKGIGAKEIFGLRDLAYCGRSEQIRFMNESLSAFMQYPDFHNYVRLIVECRGSFSWSAGKNDEPHEQILVELKNTLDDLNTEPYYKFRNLPETKTSRLVATEKQKKQAAEIVRKGSTVVKCGALIYDAQYLSFMLRLIESAKKSIELMMFFMRYEEGKPYIANPLVDGVIHAHKKGLDVKVILEKDAEGDAAGSRFVNEAAYSVLKKNEVPVLYDNEKEKTHSKLIITDGQHIVTGSHNWTAGSLIAYDDTSIYIDSKELAKKYSDIFDRHWKACLEK